MLTGRCILSNAEFEILKAAALPKAAFAVLVVVLAVDVVGGGAPAASARLWPTSGVLTVALALASLAALSPSSPQKLANVAWSDSLLNR